ncbi:fungal-specific transcription factor domain-containing protein [Xylariomycetidae sp. FL0641]|nr:fungal-specific transcription factor domain-containing protein [Xylariomycetidae sp. FL0641]
MDFTDWQSPLLWHGANTAPASAEKLASAPSSSSLKRLACDFCRERKIKCGREQPTCARCAKAGSPCHYSTRSRPTPTKTDLSRLLIAFNDRLNQAEAQLTFGPMTTPLPPTSSSSDGATTPNFGALWPLTPPPAYPQGKQFPFEDETLAGMTQVPDDAMLCDPFEKSFNPEVHDLSTLTQPSLEEGTLGEDSAFDFGFYFTPEDVPNVSAGTSGWLHDRYFDVLHPTLPIINRARFQSELAHVPRSKEVSALSYAMEALAASSVAGSEGDAQNFYKKSRSILDDCEAGESGSSLRNINTWQTYVLLTLYELKRPNFARAWVTLGRGIRLASMTSIDPAHAQPSMPEYWGLCLPRNQDQADVGTEVEERSRTVWAMHLFDAFGSIRTKSPPAMGKMANIPLPRPEDDFGLHNSASSMPSMQELSNQLPSTPVSAYAACLIMVFLYQECFDHIRSSFDDPSHSFWEIHYRIEKLIKACCAGPLATHMSDDRSEDPLSLSVRMNIDAIEISLQRRALLKIQQEDLSAALASEAASRCATAVQDIVEAIQYGRQLTGSKRVSFGILGVFLLWPVASAIQACQHILYRAQECGDTTQTPAPLQVLISFMGDLADSKHAFPGLYDATAGSSESSATNVSPGDTTSEAPPRKRRALSLED